MVSQVIEERKKLAKSFIDQNIWDGEDRSGASGDCVAFNPDELQELIDELIVFLHQSKSLTPGFHPKGSRKAFSKMLDISK